jgi:hypothetical protein
MGESRFNIGVAAKLATKTSYRCSLAVNDRLGSPQADVVAKQLDHKEELAAHYSGKYMRPPGTTCTVEQTPASGPVDQFVGTKRPDDSWTFISYDPLYSFYAGKVV